MRRASTPPNGRGCAGGPGRRRSAATTRCRRVRCASAESARNPATASPVGMSKRTTGSWASSRRAGQVARGHRQCEVGGQREHRDGLGRWSTAAATLTRREAGLLVGRSRASASRAGRRPGGEAHPSSLRPAVSRSATVAGGTSSRAAASRWVSPPKTHSARQARWSRASRLSHTMTRGRALPSGSTGTARRAGNERVRNRRVSSTRPAAGRAGQVDHRQSHRPAAAASSPSSAHASE